VTLGADVAPKGSASLARKVAALGLSEGGRSRTETVSGTRDRASENMCGSGFRAVAIG
jgi:hypothetical protein